MFGVKQKRDIEVVANDLHSGDCWRKENIRLTLTGDS